MAQDGMSASDVPLEEVSNPSFAPVRGVGEDRSVLAKLAGLLAGTHVIHSIPGRVRLRVPTLKANSNLIRGLQGLLSAQTGVTEVTVAPVCQSVTIVHDPAVWTPESLCLFLQSQNCEELDRYASAALPDDATGLFSANWLQPSRLWNATGSIPASKGALQTGEAVKSGYWRLGYASLVVGGILLPVPLLPGIPFLILSSYFFAKAGILNSEDGPEAGEQVPTAKG